MTFLKTLLAACAVALALPVQAAETPTVSDGYVRVSSAMAKSGAAFMVISNPGPEDDRLIAARSDVAERVELHTHLMDDKGVARMVEVKDGFAIPAGGSHALERGGDHVMLMGLKAPLEEGSAIAFTLVFERAGEVAVEIPVMSGNGPMGGAAKGHGHGG